MELTKKLALSVKPTEREKTCSRYPLARYRGGSPKGEFFVEQPMGDGFYSVPLQHKDEACEKSRKECDMFGYAVLFVGIILFLADVYFIFVSVGFRKKQCKRCRGYLVNTVQRKNHYSGGKAGRIYKNYIDYDYVYRVNGKEYHIGGGGPGVKSNIRQVVDIVYQKKNPKLAYIHRLGFPIQPIIAVLLSPLWIALTVCGIFLI